MGRSSRLTGFQGLGTGGLVLFLIIPHAAARPAGRAARSERIERAQIRALTDRTEVREWARKHGVKIRQDDGRRTTEIKAIRKGRPLYYVTFNSDAAVSTGAAFVRNAAPFNVSGSNVTVGVWDGGSVMPNHQEFSNRIVVKDPILSNGHATHVGGTIAASGVVPEAEGMAPAATIFSYSWTSDESEMISVAASAPGDPNRIHLSNHSYGIITGWRQAFWTNPWTHESGYHWWGDINLESAEELFGQYGSDVRYWDEIVYDAPYFLPFKAAGNERDDNPADGDTVYYSPDNGDTWTNTVYDSTVHPLGDGFYKGGYDTIPYIGNAKNIMTVGAVHDAVLNDTRSLSGATGTVFSSWGPADDGRIKPDIVANGDRLYSCDNNTPSGYTTRSGTSMSSPNACGSAALLVDYFDELFPGDAMRASTLKGLIIHTADDLGRPGPDYQFGWGLMNTLNAAELLRSYAESNPNRLTEDTLSVSNAVHIYSGFTDGLEPIRITLCWTDPPGAATYGNDIRTAALVNDLDLKLTGPDGIHYPFTLSYSNPETAAVTHVKNSVDNVEQILVNAPAAGGYTITIDYDGTLQNGMQEYALLIDGLDADQDGDGLADTWEIGYFENLTNALPLADPDNDGQNNMAEYIGGSDPTNPASTFGAESIYALPSTGQPPIVITWDALPRRVYNVHWTYLLEYIPFENISGDLPWPVSSYTDTVQRTIQRSGHAAYYKIDVRLEE